MARSAPRPGIVVAFDAQLGLGSLRDDDGAEHQFHATAISNGTRRVDVGTPVFFGQVASHGGVTEACPVIPVTPR
jgi:cold shock CspA family protein